MRERFGVELEHEVELLGRDHPGLTPPIWVAGAAAEAPKRAAVQLRTPCLRCAAPPPSSRPPSLVRRRRRPRSSSATCGSSALALFRCRQVAVRRRHRERAASQVRDAVASRRGRARLLARHPPARGRRDRAACRRALRPRRPRLPARRSRIRIVAERRRRARRDGHGRYALARSRPRAAATRRQPRRRLPQLRPARRVRSRDGAAARPTRGRCGSQPRCSATPTCASRADRPTTVGLSARLRRHRACASARAVLDSRSWSAAALLPALPTGADGEPVCSVPRRVGARPTPCCGRAARSGHRGRGAPVDLRAELAPDVPVDVRLVIRPAVPTSPTLYWRLSVDVSHPLLEHEDWSLTCPIVRVCCRLARALRTGPSLYLEGNALVELES